MPHASGAAHADDADGVRAAEVSQAARRMERVRITSEHREQSRSREIQREQQSDCNREQRVRSHSCSLPCLSLLSV